MSSFEVLTPSQTELVKAWWKKVNSQQIKGIKKTITGRNDRDFDISKNQPTVLF
jgi:hypothetical protein